VSGYIVDIIQNDTIIEIQTGNFSKIRKKLAKLLEHYKVKLVYPIACEKELVVYDSRREKILYRRRSPKRGKLIDVVDEIIYIPKLIAQKTFSLEAVLIKEEEIRAADGEGSWRRRGVSVVDRKLVKIVDRIEFLHVRDYLKLLPDHLPSSFTNKDIADVMCIPMRKAQKLTYSLRQMGLLRVIGKKGNTQVFQIEYP
jgi:hypothetical protein